MADHDGNWHNTNGGLPFRAPTVDQALPYSPFTSVAPFSPDIIPFPSAEPPTPPTTLSAEQQAAARKSIGVLNEEIKGPPSTAQRLEETLRELRDLLGRPEEMSQFSFKPISRLATPPPETSSAHTNGAGPTKTPVLSPFAGMLLRQTEVHYDHGIPALQRPKVNQDTSRKPPASSNVQVSVQAPVSASAAQTQNGHAPLLPSTPTSSSSSQPRSGPAVVIKPLSPTARRDEYRRYDQMPASGTQPQQKRAEPPKDNALSMLRPQDREIAEHKISQFRRMVRTLYEEKDDIDRSENFTKVECVDTDVTVLMTETLDRLYDKVMTLDASRCFEFVSAGTILRLHSLCEPSITVANEATLFDEHDLETWGNSLEKAEAALKAARLILFTMLKGPDDRRLSSEDLVGTISELMKRVLQQCIIPITESRRSDKSSELFSYALRLKEKVRRVLFLSLSIMQQLATVIGKVSLSDSVVNPIEYLAFALLLQPNSDSEKDSVFGIQKFESLRQAAMEVLVQIFTSHADHQHQIIGEILTNLEKLPDKKANARQFKSTRDQPIMTVSALFMRFVQVAATHQPNQHKTAEAPDPQRETSSSNESDDELASSSKNKAKDRPKSHDSAKATARKLMPNATDIAFRIASALTSRALNVSKTGDKPFRNLLDMFVEDFCNVLGSPGWPASSILLMQLYTHMYSIVMGPSKGPSNAGSNRDMALSLLGTMGCGIIDLKLRTKLRKHELDIAQSDLSAQLVQLVTDALDGSVHEKDLLNLQGPYRVVIEGLPEYLRGESSDDNRHLHSARGSYVTLWLDSVIQAIASSGQEAPPDQDMVTLESDLESMVMESNWLNQDDKFRAVTDKQCQLAAGIVALQQPFCKRFTSIVNIMLKQTLEAAATLKSRATKNIESFLDKDPKALPENAVLGVLKLLTDISPLVRAETVSLVAKCLEGNPEDPHLERRCLNGLLALTGDSSNQPKKKAIALLKKIYMNTKIPDHKLTIIVSLLLPSQDDDKPTAELARQSLEEFWLGPLGSGDRLDDNLLKLRRLQRASLLVQTVRLVRRGQEPERYLDALEKFFADALSSKASKAPVHATICGELVTDMVEGVISPESMGKDCSQDHILITLSILIRVRPGLITQDQLQLLKLYFKNPATSNDLEILRPTVTIFRYALPHLSQLRNEFADDVWTLISSITPKLATFAARDVSGSKDSLSDVMHCAWIVSSICTNGVTKLMNLAVSTLLQLQLYQAYTEEKERQAESKIRSYLILIGLMGKICSFDNLAKEFQLQLSQKVKKFLESKKATMAQLQGLVGAQRQDPSAVLLEAVRPFTKQPWKDSVRECALSSMGEICQGASDLFDRADVKATFRDALKGDKKELKLITLGRFRDFFAGAERVAEPDIVTTGHEQAGGGAGPLGIAFVASENQRAATVLAGDDFFELIRDMALNNKDEVALLATKILVSISRQGIRHPKDCGVVLVALSSSPDVQIAAMASEQHKKVHGAHETTFEKDYMDAIRKAYEYHQAVYDDPHGMNASTYKPKLESAFDVLKGGNRKTLKKFLVNLCQSMDFDLPTLESEGPDSSRVPYARFCLENLAVFEAAKMEDIAILLNSLESIVMKNTGPSIAVAIETELPKKDLVSLEWASIPRPEMEQQVYSSAPPVADMPAAAQPVADTVPPPPMPAQGTISDTRLLQIARACIILQMMWETRGFVRKAYNLGKLVGRIPQKDFQKPATRNNLISGKELWSRLEVILNSTDSRDAMLARCYEFGELLEVDKDAHIGSEDEGDDMLGYITPEEVDEEATVPSSGRGRKRKSSITNGNTPKKARARLVGGKKKRNSKTPELDDWD